jgi:hypothetical protein
MLGFEAEGNLRPVGIRLAWMKRYGMVAFDEKERTWSLSPGGRRVVAAQVRAPALKAVEAMPDESAAEVAPAGSFSFQNPPRPARPRITSSSGVNGTPLVTPPIVTSVLPGSSVATTPSPAKSSRRPVREADPFVLDDVAAGAGPEQLQPGDAVGVEAFAGVGLGPARPRLDQRCVGGPVDGGPEVPGQVAQVDDADPARVEARISGHVRPGRAARSRSAPSASAAAAGTRRRCRRPSGAACRRRARRRARARGRPPSECTSANRPHCELLAGVQAEVSGERGSRVRSKLRRSESVTAAAPSVSPSRIARRTRACRS